MLRFEKPAANTRNTAELKEDYSSDDDEYIMSVRFDLLRFCEKLNQKSTEKNDIYLKSMKKQDLEDLIHLYQHDLHEIIEVRRAQV